MLFFILLRFVINAISLLVVAKIVPGVMVAGFGSALLAAAVMGLVNAFVRPLLLLLALPITLLTLGLFSFVVNGIVLLLVSDLVPGFDITTLGAAIVAGFVLWIISLFTSHFLRS